MSDKHGADFQIIGRSPDLWLAACKCKAKFTGGTYEAAEDEWRKHVYELTGFLIAAWGPDKENLWSPFTQLSLEIAS